jgi:hypothetical protein
MNNNEEKLEALSTLGEFNERLLKNIPTIVHELSGNRQQDTEQYLGNIINSINWEISVTNATLDIINDGVNRIDKEYFNQKVLALGTALSAGEDAQISIALQNLIPSFVELGNAVNEVLKKYQA